MAAKRIAQAALVLAASVAFASARTDPDAGKTVLYRDEYGVPHIYAPTAEAGAYAAGWAQCEDRLEELLKNYLRSLGEMAAAFGPSELDGDLQARLWRHYEIARKNYDRIRPEVRRHLAAYVQGINDYMAAHRAEVPPWWGERKVDVTMAVAHSRWFMWGWPAGQALGELRAAGVAPGFSADARSSNEMALAPSRTSMRAPILVIDPHLSWWGAQRFWEFRIHAGALHGSGFNIPGGLPYVGLGHNDHVAWAMTTGGPDTADIYVLELDPQNPLRYRYDGGWKTLALRKVTIAIRGEAPREVTFHDAHNGPVVGRKGGNAYVARLAYADEVQFGESFYLFNLARSVAEFRRGLDLNQLMPQNVMVADTSGNIYYQRSGRVPIRPEGYDFTQPVDGSTSKTEWLGIHPASELMSIENPSQGYMQNCNVAPDVMMVGSPLTPASARRPYMFYQREGRTHQRGARAVELLDRARGVTPEEAMAIALDDRSFQYERWTSALRDADARFGASHKGNGDYQSALGEIAAWDGRSSRDSRGALKFYYWRQAARAALGAGYPQAAGKLDDTMAALGKSKGSSEPLSEAEQKGLVDGLVSSVRTMRRNHGRIDLVYGDVFRVGRDDRSWPVGGGSLGEEGMATLRALGFGAPRTDHTRWGVSGQTSTEVVVLTRPIRSWTQPPIGQSDRPESPFYRDQAEKLFGPGRMKPTWYQKDDLLKHVSSRQELPVGPMEPR